MKGSEHHELIDRALAGGLKPEEQRQSQYLLHSDPAFKALWDQELALNRALATIPNAPLSSNFTSIVLQKVRNDHSNSQRWEWTFPWFRTSWSKAIGAASLVLALTAFGVHSFHISKRHRMAQNLEEISPLASVLALAGDKPAEVTQKIDLLADFEAIHTLACVPAHDDVDFTLMAALEK